MSKCLWPYELQYSRLPFPSLSPRVCSNSCPLSCWCHSTISSSVATFSSNPQSFPASGSSQMSQLFASVGQSIVVSASASVLPMNIQGWFPLGLTGLISLRSKGLSRVFSRTTIWKHRFFGTQSLHGPTLKSVHDYWKNHSLTIQTFVGKMMSLLDNMPSKFLTVLLPRSKQPFNFMASVTVRSDFGAQEYKICHSFHFFPTYLPWSDGTGCHNLSLFSVEF